MALLPIIKLPDPILRQRSVAVERVDDEARRFAERMLDSMYDAPGIGLAAVQVGTPRRIVTVDVSRDEENRQPMVLFNPEIVARSDETSVYEEGCLSIPDYYAEVERPARVTVRFLDREGRPAEMEAEGLLATCLQHEIDHLDGVLFIDHLSRLKRDLVVRRFTKKAARLAESEGKPGRKAG